MECHAIHDRHDNKILRKSHISDDGWFPNFSIGSGDATGHVCM